MCVITAITEIGKRLQALEGNGMSLMCELYKDQIDGRRFFRHEHLHKERFIWIVEH